MERNELINIALEYARLVDCHGWRLAAAKAGFNKRTGIVVKCRSKDDFVRIMAGLVRGLERGIIEPDGIKLLK